MRDRSDAAAAAIADGVQTSSSFSKNKKQQEDEDDAVSDVSCCSDFVHQFIYPFRNRDTESEKSGHKQSSSSKIASAAANFPEDDGTGDDFSPQRRQRKDTDTTTNYSPDSVVQITSVEDFTNKIQSPSLMDHLDTEECNEDSPQQDVEDFDCDVNKRIASHIKLEEIDKALDLKLRAKNLFQGVMYDLDNQPPSLGLQNAIENDLSGSDDVRSVEASTGFAVFDLEDEDDDDGFEHENDDNDNASELETMELLDDVALLDDNIARKQENDQLDSFLQSVDQQTVEWKLTIDDKPVDPLGNDVVDSCGNYISPSSTQDEDPIIHDAGRNLLIDDVPISPTLLENTDALEQKTIRLLADKTLYDESSNNAHEIIQDNTKSHEALCADNVSETLIQEKQILKDELASSTEAVTEQQDSTDTTVLCEGDNNDGDDDAENENDDNGNKNLVDMVSELETMELLDDVALLDDNNTREHENNQLDSVVPSIDQQTVEWKLTIDDKPVDPWGSDVVDSCGNYISPASTQEEDHTMQETVRSSAREPLIQKKQILNHGKACSAVTVTEQQDCVDTTVLCEGDDDDDDDDDEDEDVGNDDIDNDNVVEMVSELKTMELLDDVALLDVSNSRKHESDQLDSFLQSVDHETVEWKLTIDDKPVDPLGSDVVDSCGNYILPSSTQDKDHIKHDAGWKLLIDDVPISLTLLEQTYASEQATIRSFAKESLIQAKEIPKDEKACSTVTYTKQQDCADTTVLCEGDDDVENENIKKNADNDHVVGTVTELETMELLNDVALLDDNISRKNEKDKLDSFLQLVDQQRVEWELIMDDKPVDSLGIESVDSCGNYISPSSTQDEDHIIHETGRKLLIDDVPISPTLLEHADALEQATILSFANESLIQENQISKDELACSTVTYTEQQDCSYTTVLCEGKQIQHGIVEHESILLKHVDAFQSTSISSDKALEASKCNGINVDNQDGECGNENIEPNLKMEVNTSYLPLETSLLDIRDVYEPLKEENRSVIDAKTQKSDMPRTELSHISTDSDEVKLTTEVLHSSEDRLDDETISLIDTTIVETTNRFYLDSLKSRESLCSELKAYCSKCSKHEECVEHYPDSSLNTPLSPVATSQNQPFALKPAKFSSFAFLEDESWMVVQDDMIEENEIKFTDEDEEIRVEQSLLQFSLEENIADEDRDNFLDAKFELSMIEGHDDQMELSLMKTDLLDISTEGGASLADSMERVVSSRRNEDPSVLDVSELTCFKELMLETQQMNQFRERYRLVLIELEAHLALTEKPTHMKPLILIVAMSVLVGILRFASAMQQPQTHVELEDHAIQMKLIEFDIF